MWFTLCIKEWKTRTTNHSLLHGKPTILHLKFPRLECKKCHKTFSEKYTEFPKASKVTMKTVTDALELYSEWTATNASVAKTLNISPTTAQNIFDRYVNPKRRTLPGQRYFNKNRHFQSNLPIFHKKRLFVT